MASAKTLKRSLFLSFVAAAMLPVLAISILVLYDLTGDRARDIDEKNLLLAKAISGQVEGFLREPQATLHSIGGVLESHPDMKGDEIQDLLETIIKNSELFESIYIIDPSGQTQFIGLRPERTGLRKDFLGISLSHMPFFQKTVATGKSAWSDTFFSVISGEVSLALTLPINNGILVGNFSIRPLTEFIQKLHGTESIIISVVDRAGTTIAHPDPTLAAQQVHVGHLEPVRAALEGREETLHYMFNQEEYIGSSVLIPGPNWAILVSQTATAAYRQVRFTGIVFAAGAIGALLLSIIFSLSKATRLSKPLSALTVKTDAIASGQYDVSFTNSGYVEFDDLASNVRHMTAAIRDRELQLTKSRERYRLLVETMNDGLNIVDQNGTITYANPGFAKILGTTADELIGQQVTSLFNEKNLAIFKEQFQKRTDGIENPYELGLIRSDGAEVMTMISPKALFEEGKYIGSFSVISDITARKNSESLVQQALLDAEEARDKIDAILFSVPLGLIVTNMQGRIILMNRSAGNTLGYSVEELLQKPIENALKEMDFQKHFAATITKQGDGQPIDLELHDHGLGETRTIQISSSLVQSQDEVQTGVVIVLNDVTGERESDRMKSEFIATAAHELGTPLTAIMGYAELLLQQDEIGPFPADQLKEFYTTILERSEALSRITEDLLHLSHMESGRHILIEKTPFVIEETINQVVDQYRKETPNRTYDIRLNGQQDKLNLDRGRIIQVLENLIGNAVKYSQDGGTVAIEEVKDKDWYRLDIIDDGIGMTEEQISRIYEKFYRANPSLAAVSGLGMGMSIVKSIIDAHQGQINIDSQFGQGTRIIVRLPLN